MSAMEPAAVKTYAIRLCDLCVKGISGECHTPGCSMFLNRAPDIPLEGSPMCVPLASLLAEAREKAIEECAKLVEANYPCECCADCMKDGKGEVQFCESYGCHSFRVKAAELRSLLPTPTNQEKK